MELKHLETFITVVRLKSFSKAAEALYMTQPSVTSNIQKLEKDLGTTLLNRRSRQLTLTTQGKQLYPLAVEMINLRDLTLNEMSGHKENPSGILEIYASSIPGQYFLPSIIQAFQQQFPSVTFMIRQKDSDEILSDILDGMINCGFTGGIIESESLDYMNLFSDRLLLITSPDKTIPPSSPVMIESLFTESLILREEGSGTRKLLENALEKKGLHVSQFSEIIQSDNGNIIKKMVQLGIGISFMSEIAVQQEVNQGLLNAYPIQNMDLTRNFTFVASRHRHLSPAEKALKLFLENRQMNE